ncbi:MAG: hypothetical protein KBC57_00975 [Neisseriaceae bacterium]|nr:hypothetical protein [Neisseriaceae bacterium]
MKTVWLSIILASLSLTACVNQAKEARKATAIDAPPPHVQPTNEDISR